MLDLTCRPNNASNSFGGIYCSDGNVESNILFQNQSVEGGGLWLGCFKEDMTVQSNLIFTNKAVRGGGAFVEGLCDSNPQRSLLLANNTIYGNVAEEGGGLYLHWMFDHIDLSVRNSILWNNPAAEGTGVFLSWQLNPAVLRMDHCDVEGGQSSVFVGDSWEVLWGDGMIDEDPRFADSAQGDFHLLHPSPCRDAGVSGSFLDPWDFEGDPRLSGSGVDMGADEFHPRLYFTGTPSPGEGVLLKLIGLPEQPAWLYVAAGLLERPQSTKYGLWWLNPPVAAFDLGPMPWSGLTALPQRIPPDCAVPLELALQGLARELTNPILLRIQ